MQEEISYSSTAWKEDKTIFKKIICKRKHMAT